MAKIIFFNLPSRQNIYLNTNVKVGAPSYPNLTLATLAGGLVKNNEVVIYDLDLEENTAEGLNRTIKRFNPDIIATSAKTPDYPSAERIMSKIKKKFPKIIIIIGGVHVTAIPQEIVGKKCFDIIAIGEGDLIIPEIISCRYLKDVPGIFYKKANGRFVFSGKRDLIKDLDSLPYPAWNLFDLKKYKNSRLSSRQNPVGFIETSRGCSYRCNFCSKKVFGTFFRVKSVNRVVDEIEYMLKAGFKEIHIADDSFTQNISRAKEICRLIIKRKLNFPWSLINGIRVNFVDEEFFDLAKKAGLWQTGLGIESGDQKVLNAVGKGTTLRQIERAVKAARSAGIETFGFFIFGLLGETEKSLQKTIEFAKELPLDTAKFDICIPYPGTRYYEDLMLQGNIISKDWEKYSCHQIEEPLYNHPNLSWETIGKYYRKAFREYYLRPEYIAQRIVRDLKNGDLLYDLKYFLQARW